MLILVSLQLVEEAEEPNQVIRLQNFTNSLLRHVSLSVVFVVIGELRAEKAWTPNTNCRCQRSTINDHSKCAYSYGIHYCYSQTIASSLHDSELLHGKRPRTVRSTKLSRKCV
jgi:hypothetical protein